MTGLALLGNLFFVLSKELIAASTKPLVLAILSRGENYGYELIREIKEASNENIQWSEGMLYPFLHWMEKEGLIKSEWRAAENGRKRKYYRLSRKGSNELAADREQWLAVHQTLTKLWKLSPHLT